MTNIAAPKPSLAGHEQRITSLETDVCRHEAFITGNGSIGAKTEIELLKTAVGDIKDSFKGVQKALWALAASVIGAVIIWLITVYFPGHM
jgi:HAMP domain-containing protein